MAEASQSSYSMSSECTKPTEQTGVMETDLSESEPNYQTEMRMFSKIFSSNRTIRSQQRGEPDLKEKEKVDILYLLLREKTGTFLMRFGSLLDASDLSHIESMVKIDYEVAYRLKDLRKQLGLSTKSLQKQIQNRRFQCLQHLMENSSYFTEEEMRNRNPLLFERYIGQYLTQEEKDGLDMGDTSDMTLSRIIINKMDIDKRREVYRRQQDLESGQLQENDSDEEDDCQDQVSEVSNGKDEQIDSDEKRRLRQDYLRVMQLSFLNGEDKEFDYSKVDHSEVYDSLEMIGRDAEDAYFDEEVPMVNFDTKSTDDMCDDDVC